MTDPVDDLEAIRTVVKALEPFGPEDRERIIRWASEKLGMATHAAINVPTKPVEPASRIPAPSDPTPLAATTAKDICSFIATKQPRSDNQLAAVVAYFYHFEAPEAERKDSIGKEELVDAESRTGIDPQGLPRCS